MSATDQIRKEIALLAELAARAESACLRCYVLLAPIEHQWPDRHSAAGQALLVELRDLVAGTLDKEPQEVQDIFSTNKGALEFIRSMPGFTGATP